MAIDITKEKSKQRKKLKKNVFHLIVDSISLAIFIIIKKLYPLLQQFPF